MVAEFSSWLQEQVVAEGLVRIYKPYGIPSTAITEMYKRVSREKVGHGGTLDPLAQGAMLLGVGRGTKLLSKFLESEKRYRAGILIGVSSPSGDLELPIEVDEKIELPKDIPQRTQEILAELAEGFRQEVPLHSAVKHHGKTSYQLVREGKKVEQKYIETKLLESKVLVCKKMNLTELSGCLFDVEKKLESSFAEFFEISAKIGGYPARKYQFMLEKWCNNLAQSRSIVEKIPQSTEVIYIEIEVLVPKGTYIRSLAGDIASRIGTKGILTFLERKSAGNI